VTLTSLFVHQALRAVGETLESDRGRRLMRCQPCEYADEGCEHYLFQRLIGSHLKISRCLYMRGAMGWQDTCCQRAFVWFNRRLILWISRLRHIGLVAHSVHKQKFYMHGIPLLALGRHGLVRCKYPLSGIKRTCRFALHMSAFDLKWTFVASASARRYDNYRSL